MILILYTDDNISSPVSVNQTICKMINNISLIIDLAEYKLGPRILGFGLIW